MPSSILDENFDSYSDGDLNGQGSWAGSALFQVQGVTVQAGTKAVKLITAGSEVSVVKVGSAQNDGSQVVYMRLAQTNAQGNITFLDSSSNVCMSVYFNTSGRIFMEHSSGGSGQVDIQAYSANTWYKILFEWRSSDHKYQVTIDAGTATGYQPSINANVDTADRINLSGRNTGTFYWDSLAVGINNYTRSLSDSISNGASRLATVSRLAGYLRSTSDSITNGASRLATVARVYGMVRGLSDSVMNGASRLATVASVLTYGWHNASKNVASTMTGLAKSATSSMTNFAKNTASWINRTKL